MNNDEAEQFLLKAPINYKELLWTDDVSVFVLDYLSVVWFTFFFFFLKDSRRIQANTWITALCLPFR